MSKKKRKQMKPKNRKKSKLKMEKTIFHSKKEKYDYNDALGFMEIMSEKEKTSKNIIYTQETITDVYGIDIDAFVHLCYDFNIGIIYPFNNPIFFDLFFKNGQTFEEIRKQSNKIYGNKFTIDYDDKNFPIIDCI